MIRSAFIEGDNRFWLLRDWSNGDPKATTLTFVMLNPSTADGRQDDPTIRKCVGFASKLGYGRMYVVNLFSKRATDPVELRFGVGRWMTNLMAVRVRLKEADGLIVAWGASVMQAQPEPRGRALRALAGVIQEHDVEPPMCFGVSKHGGHPRHPLMLPYTTEVIPWKGYNAPEWGFLK
jgi:hypothetical protein